jgi:hypothetical protein
MANLQVGFSHVVLGVVLVAFRLVYMFKQTGVATAKF